MVVDVVCHVDVCWCLMCAVFCVICSLLMFVVWWMLVIIIL